MRLAFQDTEDDLKLFLRILSTFIITTLIHIHDQATYVWSTPDPVQIQTATNTRTIRRLSFTVGKSTINPHLSSGLSFLSTQEY